MRCATVKKLNNWMKQNQLIVPSYLLEHFRDFGITEQDLVLLLQVMNLIEQGDHFPSPEVLSERMTLSEAECRERLFGLLRKNILAIKRDVTSEGMSIERFELEPLYDKISFHFIKSLNKVSGMQEENLYALFEQEFGRPLTPMEGELLTQFIDVDEFEPQLIRLALKEAVIASALSFRYIEKILFDWKKKGITTPKQATAYSEKFRGFKKVQASTEESTPKNLKIYNWVEA